ncbi:hypothetical protein BGW38_000460 [Lunasporangiospora selenospora]|uniref:DUF2433 domain-containing protein n=1 Tax=Lunasporangiospora selenospora TaxID=979761 RepID=A0A9P6FWZ4_9FUNG|nr:hypothetical protein BGW38_000460 [Lunasporangiospora selenospora]
MNSPSPQLINTPSGKVLCVADLRGNISQLNDLVDQTGARVVIHSGDFGFYVRESLNRISDRTLKHLVQYSTLIPPALRTRLLQSTVTPDSLRTQIQSSNTNILSELPFYLSGQKTLKVPVYTVWGACEDVAVLEKFRSNEYSVHNLHILDESSTAVIDIGGVKLRLFGLGGAIAHHKLFDIGDGTMTIAGGSGTMWTTALQIGQLVDTAQKVFDPTETRILVSHASPGREGILAQLALVLKADFTISAGLHFRYGISYNEFGVQGDQELYRNKLVNSQKNFMDMWEGIKAQVESKIRYASHFVNQLACHDQLCLKTMNLNTMSSSLFPPPFHCFSDEQKVLLENCMSVINRLPLLNSMPNDKDEAAFKNLWNFNLPDASSGLLLLDINQGKIATETRSQGFNFSYRRNNVSLRSGSPVVA